MHRILAATRKAFLAVALGVAVAAPHTRPAAAAPTVAEIVDAFSDDELIAGFMATVFGRERIVPGDGDFILRYETPVRVFIDNRASVDRTSSIRWFLHILDATVRNLAIRETNDRSRANMIVFLIDRIDYRRTIREVAPDNFDTRFLEANTCSALIFRQARTGFTRSLVFVVANEGGSRFQHCMIEEIMQSLGPVNDVSALTHSIFNDQSRVGGFSVFDWFILNMLYDRRVRSGMTPSEVMAVLPAAIRDARGRLPDVLSRRSLPAR